MKTLLSLVLFGIGIQAACMATPVNSPEIDPASCGSVIALVAGAIVVIRGRRK